MVVSLIAPLSAQEPASCDSSNLIMSDPIFVGVVSGPSAGVRGFGKPLENDLWQVSRWNRSLPPVVARRDQLRVVPQSWLDEAMLPRFQLHAICEKFEAPNLDDPVTSLSRFLMPTPPGSAEVESWWGSRVFKSMMELLCQKLEHPPKKWEQLRHFRWRGPYDIRCGIVYSDCDKAHSLLPRSTDHALLGPQQWWPILFCAGDDRWHCSALCQDQALTGSKPWSTHISRVVLLRVSTAKLHAYISARLHANMPIPRMPNVENETTVIIEELPDENRIT